VKNIQGEYYPFQKTELMALRKSKLISNTAFVYLALNIENPSSDSSKLFIPSLFAIRWEIPESSVYEAIAKLKAAEMLPTWVSVKEYSDTEKRIRDRLKTQLNGAVEVVTAVGRVDLLTATEVIEIKEINDWKEALGKLLAYSSFFPQHSKRIHLFGRLDMGKLALATAMCRDFDITVTFEEV
jgi:hypothetical protein